MYAIKHAIIGEFTALREHRWVDEVVGPIYYEGRIRHYFAVWMHLDKPPKNVHSNMAIYSTGEEPIWHLTINGDKGLKALLDRMGEIENEMQTNLGRS